MRNIIAGTIVLFFTISANAQPSKSEFHKTVAGINAIIKMNKLPYYTDHKQNSAFIKQISATKQGIINFTDSIAKAESNTHQLTTNRCSYRIAVLKKKLER
jgi:hypothetical protein